MSKEDNRSIVDRVKSALGRGSQPSPVTENPIQGRFNFFSTIGRISRISGFTPDRTLESTASGLDKLERRLDTMSPDELSKIPPELLKRIRDGIDESHRYNPKHDRG